MKKYPLVRVDWVDSAFTEGWRSRRAHVDTAECQTTGFLIEKTKKQVVVAMNSSEAGSYGEAMAIPAACVRKIRKVRVG